MYRGKLVLCLVAISCAVSGPATVLADDKPVRDFEELEYQFIHTGHYFNVAYSRAGFVAATDSLHVRVWNLETKKIVKKLDEIRLGSIQDIGFSPDGKLFARARSKSPTVIWRTGDWKVHHEVGGKDGAAGVWFTPDSKRLYTCRAFGTVHEWDMESGNEIRSFDSKLNLSGKMDISPNGKWLAFGGYNGELHVLTADKHEVKWKANLDKGYVRRVVFSPDSQWLAAVSSRSELMIFDLAAGEVKRTMKIWEKRSRYISDAMFVPGTNFLAIAGDDPDLWAVNAASGEKELLLKGAGNCLDVCFSRDGALAITTSQDRVKSWKMPQLKKDGQ